MDLSEINKDILTLNECEIIHKKENVDLIVNNGKITEFQKPVDARLKDSVIDMKLRMKLLALS